MAADLAGYIKELGFGKHREFLSGVARPSVEIITADTPEVRSGSKFGGSPDLPADFEWPHHEFGPYRFIGQVNLADVPKAPHGLPGVGLLSFFYAHDEDGELFAGDPDYVRVFRFDTVAALQPVEPPAAVRFGAGATVTFRPGEDVPPWPWSDGNAEKWPIDESQRDAYRELRCRLHPGRRYLLGYPFNTTLAYDPTPGPAWRSLLTLASDDEMEWCWADGDWLVTFIEQQRLQAGDFSQVQADAG
jgi:uncharacterized protein YwqG